MRDEHMGPLIALGRGGVWPGVRLGFCQARGSAASSAQSLELRKSRLRLFLSSITS